MLYLPDFISAWTGTDGRFTLHLPLGNYFWVAIREFPTPKVLNIVGKPAAENLEIRLVAE